MGYPQFSSIVHLDFPWNKASCWGSSMSMEPPIYKPEKHYSCIRLYPPKPYSSRAKVRSPTVSNRLPLDTFGPSKKTALRGNANHDALVFWCHPCARTLHQILHLDLDIQYSLKITKSQELVKFNTQAIICVNLATLSANLVAIGVLMILS